MALGGLPKPAQAQHIIIWYSAMKCDTILQPCHKLNMHCSCSSGEGQPLSLKRDGPGTTSLRAAHANPGIANSTQPTV